MGSGAMKHDGKKAPMSLIPYRPMMHLAKALDFGKNKYKAWNWAEGFEWSRLIDAMERHLGEFKDGRDKDEESGLYTLAHVGCCWLFLFSHQLYNLGIDDRHKWEDE